MKAYYEVSRELVKGVGVNRNQNYAYTPHFHSHVELLIVNKGNCEINCNGKKQKITEGHIVFFNSYDIHGYCNNNFEGEDHAVVIIPLKYTERFFANRKKLKVKNNVIYAPKLCGQVLEIVDRLIINYTSEKVASAAVELIFALLEEHLQFTEDCGNGQHILIKNMLSVLDNEFTTDVSLPYLSKRLGYTEAHLSRTFHQYINQSINQYVNDLRINYVQTQLALGDQTTITDLIYKAGFKSVQTYYRNLQRHKIEQ